MVIIKLLRHFLSVFDREKCRTMSNNVEQCRTMSNNVVQCRTMSYNVEQCRTMSNNVEQCRTMSKNVVVTCGGGPKDLQTLCRNF